MNIAVCDDEELIRKQLIQKIKRQLPDSCVAAYSSGRQLLADSRVYDILLLDIQMEGFNGIETAKALRRKAGETVLIFITGSKEYVFEAFDVAAFHYLLKPIGEAKLAEVLERAAAEVSRNTRQKVQQLFVKTRQRSFTVDTKDILYIESQRRRAEIHMHKESITVYASMKELEVQLGGQFYRCHRGYLVNMAYIAEYKKDSIVLKNGEMLYLSRERYGDFVKAYMRYLQKGGAMLV